MFIPAYIIDHIQKEKRNRENTVWDELHIQNEQVIPDESSKIEPNDSAPKRGVAEIDFFN